MQEKAWKRIRFAGGVLAFTFLWFCVRFPFEALGVAKRILPISSRLDPSTLHLGGEFVESNLGAALEPDGSVTVRLIAQQHLFVQQCMTVPVGRPIRFRITSADVVHRFAVSSTDQAIEVVPGYVSESQLQFEIPGDYPAPCREFCGAGHYTMRSSVVAVAQERFPKLAPRERLACASR
jgi:cytochrome c oxidase subunit 2